ncbi:Ras family GTPase [Pelomyxa schiedti]|nr:Ras family GTPase [Pelomyxa schiedti]
MGDMLEEIEMSLKVLVVGNGQVGKTSLIRRFAKDTYTDEYKKTIGVDFLEKQFFVPSVGESVKMMLWDTAGQEEQFSITRNFFSGASAAVIAFSTVDRASFDAIGSWIDKVKAECGPIAMVLMQNKVDLMDHAVVSNKEVEDAASRFGLRLYRVSVKDNLNVVQLFQYLVELYVKRRNQAPPPVAVQVGDFGDTRAPVSNTTTKGAFQLEKPTPVDNTARKKSSGKC